MSDLPVAAFEYQVGGPLAWDHPTYIERQADLDLRAAIAGGELGIVTAPPQSGKSSLRLQMAQDAREQGYLPVSLSATVLTSQDQRLWDQKLAAAIYQSLSNGQLAHLQASSSSFDQLFRRHSFEGTAFGGRSESVFTHYQPQLEKWFAKTANFLPPQRVEQFTRDVLLPVAEQVPLVIFIDDAEALLDIPFLAHDVMDWIAYCYSLRRVYPIYQNLKFVLLGTAPLLKLTQNETLLAQCRAIALENFELADVGCLRPGIAPAIQDVQAVLAAILTWTGGQPLLTQYMCQTVSRLGGRLAAPHGQPLAPLSETLVQWIDQTVYSYVIEDWRQQASGDHLQRLWNSVLASPMTVDMPASADVKALLRAVLSEALIFFDGSDAQKMLLLNGIIMRCNNRLQIANEIYRQVFGTLMQPLPLQDALDTAYLDATDGP